MEPCPSAFAWDDHDIHGAPFPEAVALHVDGCARCRSVQEHRRASRRAFAAHVAGPLRRRLASAPVRRRWIVPSASVLGLVAAALVLTVQLRRPEPGPYSGAKGAVAIEVAGRRDGRVFAFDGDAVAEPGDEVQLTIRAAAGLRYVLVGSVDGTGRFSAFYPASVQGRSLELPPYGHPLAPPVVLDGAPGPERIVVVLSSAPLAVHAVAQWAQRAADHPGASASEIAEAAGAAVFVRWVTLPKAAGVRSCCPRPR